MLAAPKLPEIWTEIQASAGVPMATASLLHLREERQRVGAEVGCDLRFEGLLRQSERVSLGVLADRPCLSRVDHAPTEHLDPLRRLDDVAHRDVGRGDRIAVAAPAGMNADRGGS